MWSAQACLRVGLSELRGAHASRSPGQDGPGRDSGSKLPHSRDDRMKTQEICGERADVERHCNWLVGHDGIRGDGVWFAYTLGQESRRRGWLF